MFLHYRGTKLITGSARADEVNKAILNGDYLDKTIKYTKEGEEIPFTMPSKDTMLKDYIFPQWQKGDILVIANQPLKYPKLDKTKQALVEMTREEICKSGDLTVLIEGECFENGQIKMIKKPQNKHLNYVWNKKTKTWELVTTKEQILLVKKNLILEYKKNKEEIETLEEFEDEFGADETTELLKQKQVEIKKEINNLVKLIKTL